MKIYLSTKRDCAMTLIEVFVVVVIVGFFTIIFLSLPDRNQRARAYRIQCVNNLRQIGIAYRVWEGDQEVKYPMFVSQTNGGTMEFTTGPNAWRHFQVMSNELTTPRLLFCNAETDRHRFRATNFNWSLNNSNLSYFVGIVSNDTNPQLILSGDHNITNGTPVRNGLLELTTNSPAGWTAEMHEKVGNILLADGRVQQLSIVGLQTTVANTSVSTNLLQMPILGP
jgi:hypothetical protein